MNRHFETTYEIYDVDEFDEIDSEGVHIVAFDVVLRSCQPQAVGTALGRSKAAFPQRRCMASVVKNDRQA